MQRLITPLRVCRICGLEANTEAELEQFVRNKKSAHGHLNRCKKCFREELKERKQRTAEFIRVFRERSPNGIIRCYFCGEEVTKLKGLDGDSLYIHSLDENHENWDPLNKVPTHNACHTSFHNTGRRRPDCTGERSPNWKGDAASDSAKRKRVKGGIIK